MNKLAFIFVIVIVGLTLLVGGLEFILWRVGGPSLIEPFFSLPRRSFYEPHSASGSDTSRIFDFAVYKNALYLGTDSGTLILNIADPTNIKEIGYSQELSGDFEVFDHYLYVADRTVAIYDISQSETPQKIGEYTPECVEHFCSISRMAVDADFLYLIVEESEEFNGWPVKISLRFIDISNPKSFKEIGRYPLSQELGSNAYIIPPTQNIGISRLLFIAQGQTIITLDISDPVQPKEIMEYRLQDYSKYYRQTIQDIELQNQYLYVVENHYAKPQDLAMGSSFRVIDISNIQAPIQIAQLDLPGKFANGMIFTDMYAFVSNKERGLRILDITNPKKPKEVGHYTHFSNFLRGVRDAKIYGTYVFVRSSSFEFGAQIDIVDISRFTSQ